MLSLAACSGVDAPVVPAERVREVRATGCSPGDEIATGVDVGAGLVLTVAHPLRGASAVTVDGAPATVVALDHRIDAAVLAAGRDLPAMAMARPAPGPARLLTADGARAVHIGRPVTVRIEEPRDGTVHARAGVVLDGALTQGDSGAAVIDRAGRLVGLAFATSTEAARAYAVSAAELQPLIESANGRSPVGTGSC